MNLVVVLWPEDDGREVVYHPGNRLAEALCAFAGTPVIRRSRLRSIEAMGFEVRMHGGRPVDAYRRPPLVEPRHILDEA